MLITNKWSCRRPRRQFSKSVFVMGPDTQWDHKDRHSKRDQDINKRQLSDNLFFQRHPSVSSRLKRHRLSPADVDDAEVYVGSAIIDDFLRWFSLVCGFANCRNREM